MFTQTRTNELYGALTHQATASFTVDANGNIDDRRVAAAIRLLRLKLAEVDLIIDRLHVLQAMGPTA